MGKQSRNWQNVICREWRHCEDDQLLQGYRHHLFDIVANEPVGWSCIIAVIFLVTVYGGIGGSLVWLLAEVFRIGNKVKIMSLDWIALEGYVLKGGTIGAVAGGVLGIIARKWLSWRTWFVLLAPHRDVRSRSIEEFDPRIFVPIIVAVLALLLFSPRFELLRICLSFVGFLLILLGVLAVCFPGSGSLLDHLGVLLRIATTILVMSIVILTLR